MKGTVTPSWPALVGLALRKIRQEKGLGVREMAAEVGVSQSTISRIERGHPPDAETITAFCGWLDYCPLCGRQNEGKIRVVIEAPDNVTLIRKGPGGHLGGQS